MARYFVTPGGAGVTTTHWNAGGAGNLAATVAAILAAPSRGGDEIWCRQGIYNLTGTNQLPIIQNNSEPLSIYGGFAGTEQYLCQRRANITTPPTTAIPNYFQFPSILDGGGMNTVIVMRNANVFLMDGFIIRNGNIATGTNGGGVFVLDSNNIRLENLVVMENTAGNGGGMFINGSLNFIIKNSIFFNNVADSGGGIYIKNADDTFFVNLLFNANQAVGTSGNGNAVYVDGNNLKIINNTVAGNAGSATDVYIMWGNVDIYNSIIYPDTLAAFVPALPTVTVENCCLPVLPTFPILTPNPGNLVIGNPDFVNPILPPIIPPTTVGNYHLQINPPYPNTSPCIDVGNTKYIFPYAATDLEGKPRFIDNGLNPSPPPIMQVDMGAFEVQ